MLQCLKDNSMNTNPDKYHLLEKNNKESFQINTDYQTIAKSKCKKLLEVNKDHEFNFIEHVTPWCK